MILDEVYRRLPVPLQHGAVTAFGALWAWRRFGPGFARCAREYRRRESWGEEQWRRWRREVLRRELTRAATRIPGYRDRWSAGERRAAGRGELGELPLLDKDALRADPEAFLDPRWRPRRPLVFHTSGSTGTPIATYWSLLDLRESLALREIRSARWAGVSFALPRATFSGRIVVPDPDASRGPFHRYNAVERQVYFSAFHLGPQTVAGYLDALRRHRTRWLTGYAVSIHLLARLALEADLDIPPLDAIITTSEKLTPHMATTMSRAFGCRVFEEYSSVENALFASACERGRLHVSPDVSVVEILRADGAPCEPGEVGEIVTTTLSRRLQPLIRYRIGDLGAWSGRPCGCGRALPVLAEVTGRIEDVLVGPDGRRMVRFHGLYLDLTGVVEGQVVQLGPRRFEVRVVVAAGADWDGIARTIAARMRQRLGSSIAVAVRRVSHIPRTAAGKFRAVVRAAEATGEERCGSSS